MENVKKHFAEKRNDLYARYRLARIQEERKAVIRGMQRFNMEARKYRGGVQTALRKYELLVGEYPILNVLQPDNTRNGFCIRCGGKESKW